MLPTIHFLHITFGMLWAGGTVMWVFVIVPALTGMEPQAIRAAHVAISRPVGFFLNATGAGLILTALARLFFGGSVNSLADLGSPYAIHAIAAFVTLISLAVLESRFQSRFAGILESGANPRRLRRLQLGTAFATAIGLTFIVVLMSRLGLGYY